MSRLMQHLMARLMAPAGEDGADTGGTLTATPEVLAENDMTQEEFDALDDRDKANLLATVEHDEDAPIVAESAPGAHSAAPAAAPAPAPAPTPAPAPAAPAPAPAAAPAAAKPDDGADPIEEPAAAPVAAPVAAPAPAASAWKAVENPVDDMPDATIVLPKIPEPPKWQPIATKETTEKLGAAQKAIDDLEQKYEDGDITLEELRTQRAPHKRVVEELSADVMADRVNERNTSAQLAQRFQTYVTTSLEQAKAAGLDYLAAENKGLLEQLDAALKRFGQAAALMHPGKSTDWHDRWALNKAHAEVAATKGITLGKVATAPAPAPAAKAPVAAPAGQRPAPDLSLLPPTLRNAPAAADSTVQSGEFAHLDTLDPLQLEQAVARMTPEQRDRYLSE